MSAAKVRELKAACKQCETLFNNLTMLGAQRDARAAASILAALQRQLYEAEIAAAGIVRRKGQAVLHLDGDMTNNHPSNLRIVTLPR